MRLRKRRATTDRFADAPLDGALLDVDEIKTGFKTEDGLVRAVDGVSFSLERGKTLGIVGESGSGKSVTSLGLLGLHRVGNARVSGEVWLNNEELIVATDERVRSLRGQAMAMIFQDPLTAMHPYYTIGAQIIEAYKVHHPKASKKDARERAIHMLD